MKNKTFIILITLYLFAIIPAFGINNQGGLGDIIEIDNKSPHISASLNMLITFKDSYTTIDSISDSVTIRKYISPSGRVFAITWAGLIHPDLTLLVGSYNDEYREALKHKPVKPGSRQLHMDTQNVVVQKWGHMRNLKGRVYAPALVPPGVMIDDIK